MDLEPSEEASIARVRAAVLREIGAASAIGRRRRTRHAVVIGGVLVGVLGLTGGTLAVLQASRAEIDGSVRCFAAGTTTAEYTTVIEARIEGTAADAEFAERALDVCAAVWRVGILRDGEVTSPADPSRVDHPVPNLVACRLRDGVVGVFPADRAADADSCLPLGLTPFP